MRIAVTSSGPTLDDQVDARFGRCAYFLVIDPDTLEFEPIQNPNVALGGGAGIQSAKILADKDVNIVMTGNCGPNAFQTFGAAGIQIITGVAGPVRKAVQMYKSGELDNASGSSVQSPFGMGIGRVRGMGRGMGMGGGKRMGGGMGRSAPLRQGAEYVQPSNKVMKSPAGVSSKENEIYELKEQADTLRKQLEQITTRLKKLEGEKE